jgi:hypothetical protein
MRGWGIALIRKASITDRGLGIRATHNLAERGEKGRCGGWMKNTLAKSEETGSESWGIQGRFEN